MNDGTCCSLFQFLSVWCIFNSASMCVAGVHDNSRSCRAQLCGLTNSRSCNGWSLMNCPAYSGSVGFHFMPIDGGTKFSTSRSAIRSSRKGSMSAWSMCSRPGAREDFRSRVKKNDQLKAEAKARGDVISTKRQPEGPKPGFMVEGATPETVTPIPYDVVNDLKGGY